MLPLQLPPPVVGDARQRHRRPRIGGDGLRCLQVGRMSTGGGGTGSRSAGGGGSATATTVTVYGPNTSSATRKRSWRVPGVKALFWPAPASPRASVAKPAGRECPAVHRHLQLRARRAPAGDHGRHHAGDRAFGRHHVAPPLAAHQVSGRSSGVPPNCFGHQQRAP